jgi:hypothetical protein
LTAIRRVVDEAAAAVVRIFSYWSACQDGEGVPYSIDGAYTWLDVLLMNEKREGKRGRNVERAVDLDMSFVRVNRLTACRVTRGKGIQST